MEIHKFINSWEGSIFENQAHRLVNVALAVTVVILAFLAATRDQIVIIKPPNITEEVWIESNQMYEGLHIKWSLFLATLIGNIHPQNAQFVKNAIGIHLSSSLYKVAMNELQQSVDAIKKDNVTISFRPEKYKHEKETNRTFVTGHYELAGAAGNFEKYERTYEFQIIVKDFEVIVEHMESYRGKARTKEWWEKQNERDDRKRKAENYGKQ